jgi:uncharacterized membrane protein
MSTPDPSSGTAVRPSEGMITLAYLIYSLHAFSAVSGLLSYAMVVVAFVSGWPSLVAVALNYAKRPAVQGTWLDSHFDWQIRTFWFALLWLIAGVVAFFAPVSVLIALTAWILTGLWVLYRIARGWISLSAHKPMPQSLA